MTTNNNQTVFTNTSDNVRNITGYIHYNKDDDLSKIFDVLREFRTKYKLKYSHHQEFIFFCVSSDCLNELSKQQKFKVSHYRSKSEYKCSKENADLLMKVRDSFVRMYWHEDGHVEFLSRTIGRVHNQLVRRVFKEANLELDKTCYYYHRVARDETGDKPNNTETSDFVRVSYTKPKYNRKNQSNNSSSNNEQDDSQNNVSSPQPRGRNRQNLK